MRQGDFARGRDVLDVGTGGGCAGRGRRAGRRPLGHRRRPVLRSVAATWVNCRLHRCAGAASARGPVRARCAGRRFGLVLSNPPYVPARHRRPAPPPQGALLGRRARRTALLDRICAGVPDVLTPDGTVLLVHSAVCDTDGTGRAAPCRARRPGSSPASPSRSGRMHSRARLLEARGFVGRGAAQRGAGGRGGTASGRDGSVMSEVREVIVRRRSGPGAPAPSTSSLPDGRRVRSDRPVTALCVCRRSRRAPFCDTSHRTEGPHDRDRGARDDRRTTRRTVLSRTPAPVDPPRCRTPAARSRRAVLAALRGEPPVRADPPPTPTRTATTSSSPSTAATSCTTAASPASPTTASGSRACSRCAASSSACSSGAARRRAGGRRLARRSGRARRAARRAGRRPRARPGTCAATASAGSCASTSRSARSTTSRRPTRRPG